MILRGSWHFAVSNGRLFFSHDHPCPSSSVFQKMAMVPDEKPRMDSFNAEHDQFCGALCAQELQ